ncbi:CinA family protein [Sphingobium sp. CFD-1]|uniref:CinA family protein n=1 Tax=Sphingobium sp. CFD-1 TaxID=2878545 RepID=UPI00214B6B5F|nr:CinA family protein [Sphingobium sp. CFD-1]
MEPLVDRLPEDIDVLARRLLEKACRRHLTLATAESCPGGLIGAVLTDVEGTSHAFERGFIVYSDEAKAGLLGIPRKSIDAEGAVSQPIALAMAKCPPKACSPSAARPQCRRPQSRKTDVDLVALRDQLLARKEELLAQAKAGGPPLAKPYAVHLIAA